MQQKTPELSEIVVCKITKILDYGVFVELLEYPGIQGFVHVSQVASSWVKNIRSFVKENQIRAAKVIHFDLQKNQIDLSFTKVSEGEQREKINAWKQLKRNQKLFEMLAVQKKVSLEDVWKQVAEPLEQKHGSLQNALQSIALNGIQSADVVPEKFRTLLVELVQKNVEVPKKTIRGILSMQSLASNGVEQVKKAILEAQKKVKTAELEIKYAGSGKFHVWSTAQDYKKAEKAFQEFSELVVCKIKDLGGTGSFQKTGE